MTKYTLSRKRYIEDETPSLILSEGKEKQKNEKGMFGRTIPFFCYRRGSPFPANLPPRYKLNSAFLFINIPSMTRSNNVDE
jgi:hypothetical protein